MERLIRALTSMRVRFSAVLVLGSFVSFAQAAGPFDGLVHSIERSVSKGVESALDGLKAPTNNSSKPDAGGRGSQDQGQAQPPPVYQPGAPQAPVQEHGAVDNNAPSGAQGASSSAAQRTAQRRSSRAEAREAYAHPPNIDKCNEEAAGKTGDERKAFMRQCIGQ